MMQEVASEWGTTTEAMMSPSRSTRVYSARREVIRRLRYDFQWTLKEIGFLMDRDHSTIIHSLKESDVNITSTKSEQLRVDNHIVEGEKRAHSMGNYTQ